MDIKLIYWQKIQLRNKVCQINIEDLNEEENHYIQGRNLFLLGFERLESKYPSDTYVGTNRLKGWDYQKNQSKNELNNRCECQEYDPVDVKVCSNCDGYCE